MDNTNQNLNDESNDKTVILQRDNSQSENNTMPLQNNTNHTTESTLPLPESAQSQKETLQLHLQNDQNLNNTVKPNNNMQPSVGNTPFTEPVKNTKTTKIITGIIIGIFASVIIAMIVLYVLFNSTWAKYNAKLDLAEKYLNEMDYEQAIVEFTDAIKIDPKGEAAYIGLANTYSAMANEYLMNESISSEDYDKMMDYYDQAENILKNSQLYLTSNTVDLMIENIEKKHEKIEAQKSNYEKEELKKAEDEKRRKEEEEKRKQEEERRKAEEAYAASFEGKREKMINDYGYGYNVGNIMPDFSFKNLNGKTVHLSDFLGTPLYLNTFTTWCPYCDMEVSDMQKTYNTYADKINYIMIDLAETADDARWYASKFGLNIPMYTQDSWSLGNYEVDGVPTTFVLDKYGRITDKTTGMASADWINSATLNAINASKE